MATIHLQQTTSLTPEQYVAGLTDFGPGRSKLFGNSADEYLKVHSRGDTQADKRPTRRFECLTIHVSEMPTFRSCGLVRIADNPGP